MATVQMSEGDLARAVTAGVWYPVCPTCQEKTPAEQDAQVVYCINCDQRIEIAKPYC